MRDTSAIKVGRVNLTPLQSTPRSNSGGRRPPQGPNGTRAMGLMRRVQMLRKSQPVRDWLSLGLVIAITIFGLPAVAQPALPDLSGTYRCDGDAAGCARSGSMFTMTQSGSDLQIKNEKGDSGSGKVTSNISLSAGPIWNRLGVINPADNRVIEWSNGTSWRKQ